jgi:hypothetical protein
MELPETCSVIPVCSNADQQPETEAAVQEVLLCQTDVGLLCQTDVGWLCWTVMSDCYVGLMSDGYVGLLCWHVMLDCYVGLLC